MRISDWSSDVCSSDLGGLRRRCGARPWQGKAPPAAPHGRSQGLRLLSPFPNCSQANQPLPISSHSDPPYLKGLNTPQRDRTCEVRGKSVSVRVGFGGRRIIKQKKQRRQTKIQNRQTTK